jgi:hypothetical protein
MERVMKIRWGDLTEEAQTALKRMNRGPCPLSERLRKPARGVGSRVQALRYRRLPGIEARAISSDTELISAFGSLICLGLRASLLPFLFAMTASFP